MRIVLEVDPRPQPRPRFSNGRVYTPKEIRGDKKCGVAYDER